MSSTYSDYPNEKASALEVLPGPVTITVHRQQPSFFVRFLRVTLAIFATLFIVRSIGHGLVASGVVKGCHKGLTQYGPGGDGHQHPFPPVDNWKPYVGTTHFELEPIEASGIKITGQSFGKVIFETSKLSDKVVIDLDIKTNKKLKHDEVTVAIDNGFFTVDTPTTGKIETYASAKIQIPSNLIGTFGLPAFEVDLPRHMVDLSGLPESLEIGSLVVRVAKGFVKAGPVHTNNTQLTIVDGALHGSLTHARENTNIDVTNGNVTLDITKISSGNEGVSTIHLGNGNLKGTFSVYNSTTIDVAKGSIYVTVDIQSADTRALLDTKIASGDARVYVNSIAAERTFDAYHKSVAGDQLLTYPSNFQGTIDARGLVGDIKLAGKELIVEKVLGGVVGKQGDSERNSINVKSVKGDLDILVGDEQESM